jgi:tRNA pseudouridine55 synthase
MRSPAIEGILLVDKPAGMTSHDAVAVARRALGERRIGHAGTLDPFATGLLVLLIGRATRLLPFVDGEPKVYRARIAFGAETTTDDLTGEVVRTAAPPDDAAVARAVAGLTGEIDQLPPAYSAKKVGGRRSYDAARAGQPLALRPVRVTVHGWQLGAREGGELEATITCSGGTYVRALARDLGRAAGGAAHLVALRRLRSGPFDVRDAVSVEALREGAAPVRPALEALPSLPVDELDDAALRRVLHGNPVAARVTGARAALVDGARRVVAIADREGDNWRPKVVLRDAAELGA